MAATGDHLKLTGNTQIVKMMASFSAMNERVIFSDQVSKINRKGVSQKRILLLTDKAVYNLENSKCKRRIDITEVQKVYVSGPANEFVLHVPSEYDYHYKSARKGEIQQYLEAAYAGVTGKALDVQAVPASDLSAYVVTKNDVKSMGSGRTFSFFGSSSSKKNNASGKLEHQMSGLSVASNDSSADNSRSRTGTIMHYSEQPHETVELESFELLKVLGKGSFGKVMQVKKKDNGVIYAMKVLHKDAVLERDQVEHTKAERHILQAVQHPFLVGLRYAFQTDAKLYMVLDYLNGGELFFHLKKEGRFNENRMRLYSAELTLALGHLHSLTIVYRDLKPENILLDKDGHIKITDFGLAKANVADNSSAHTFCGTPEYLAPEILSGKGHGRAVDWWSLGTLMFEMLSGLPPYYDQNVNTMYRKILQDPLTFPPFFSAKAKDILGKLLNRSPEQRLGSGPTDAEELKTHPFFDAMDWQALLDRRVVPEFKPKVQGDLDANNFDPCFTAEPAQDTPKEGSALTGAQEFDGFTFVADSALKR